MIGWWHKKVFSRFNRVRKDTRGVAAIEFAFAFPIYLLFFLNLMETGLILFGNAMVNNMLSQAARASMIGCINGEITTDDNGTRSCTKGTYTISRLKDDIETASLGLVKANDSSLFTFAVDTLDNIDTAGGQTLPAAGSVNLGNSEDVVVFYAKYKWPIFNPASIVREIFGNLIEFQTATMVRNEPYGSLTR